MIRISSAVETGSNFKIIIKLEENNQLERTYKTSAKDKTNDRID